MDNSELLERLKQANSLLRSANSIAERKGEQTNWIAFQNQLKKELELQHKILYPKVDEYKTT